jgi:hypothetical protein
MRRAVSSFPCSPFSHWARFRTEPRAFYRACWQPFGMRLFHAEAWTATGSLASGPTGTGWLAECN